MLGPVASQAAACHDPVVATARLIGRDEDVATIREAVVSARAGDARCLLVIGEAGIGKSRLVREALDGLDDALVVTGHGADMATGEIPFGVLADTLRDLVHGHGPDVLTPVEREALAPLLPGLVPAGHVERVQVLSAFGDLLQRLCADRLVVWLVEDLHWADTATRDVVNLAVRTLRGRLLLMATVRTEDPERSPADEATLAAYVAGLARIPGTTVVRLGRLSPDQVRAQLLALVGASLPPGVATRIEQLSDGVPFVVEELAAASGRPEVVTASGVAAGRLAGLSAEARRLVEAAAVGEGHLRLGLLEQVVDATPDELDGALAQAVRAGILVTDHTTDAVAFRHALLREAANRELGPGARRSWHRRWAEVLEANPGLLASDPAALAIAEHWHQTGDARRALAATVAALPAAARICRPDEESVLWTRIMQGFGALDDAAAIVGTTLREALAHALLACQYTSRPSWSDFVDAVPVDLLTGDERVAFEVMTRDDNAKGEANLLPEGPVVAAADAFEGSAPDLLATLVWALAGSRLTDAGRGETLVRRSMSAAKGLQNPRAVLAVAAVGSYRAQTSGDPAGGARLIREAMSEFPGEAWEGVLMAIGNLVWCELVLGEHDLADADVTRALARLRHPHLSVNTWEHLVENATATWLLTGQWDRARALLEESSPFWRDDVRSSNARLDLLDLMQGATTDVSRWPPQIDDPCQAVPHARRCGSCWPAMRSRPGTSRRMRSIVSPAWADETMLLSDDQLWELALVAARAEADAVLEGREGDRAAAEAHLGTISEVAGRFRRYGRLGEVWPLDLEAQLDRFHGRDARPALEAALAGWERIGHVPDVAVTHLSLAEAHAIRGDREAARRHLSAGREIAAGLDARPMLHRADALAERFALTSRERRTADILTGREAEVLALLAEGRTNAEIAAMLFMSPKTASVHVSHIIAKLGAGNRTEAAAMARRQGLLQ